MIARRQFLVLSAYAGLAAGQRSTRPLGAMSGRALPLFRESQGITLPADVVRLHTAGWSRLGVGAGSYVNDALATPGFAEEHPRLCIVAADERCFRLEARDGMITVEQAGACGDPAASGQINDQPAFQAAIDYAAAAKIEHVGLGGGAYSLWMPPRRSPLPEKGKWGSITSDGNAMVIAEGQRIRLFGLGAGRAVLRFFAPGGHSFNGRLRGEAYQLIEGRVWRGSGFFLVSKAPVAWDHADDKGGRQSLTLQHLTIDGGTRVSGNFNWPADPRDGTGWDTTHKGIFMTPDHRGADITILDCAMTGWRGETVFTSNDPHAVLRVRRSEFSHSNGQGLNPNGCMTDVDGCSISDCFSGIEGWTGYRGGRIVNTHIKRCFGVPKGPRGGSGSAMSLGCQPSFREIARQRKAGLAPDPFGPVGTVDITCQDCNPAIVGSRLQGRLRMIDTGLSIGTPYANNEGSKQINLDVVLTTDKTMNAVIIIAGGMGKAGEKRTDHVKMHVTSTATLAAETAGMRPDAVVQWSGSLGPNIDISLTGRQAKRAPRAWAATPDFSPCIHGT